MPYTAEAPGNVWVGPWKNACEEAVIAMAEQFYRQETFDLTETRTFMQNLFDVQDKLYGSNANSDAARTNYLINNYSSFTGVVRTNPTFDEIRNEIAEGRPVITFHHGFDLHNPNIPFVPTGSSYHTLILTGYDDVKQQFIVNDPGDEIAGQSHRYDYPVLMNSLHDYDFEEQKANGPARAIFTK